MPRKAMVPNPTVPAPTPNRSRIRSRPTASSGGASLANGGAFGSTIGVTASAWATCAVPAVGVSLATMATRVGIDVGMAIGVRVGDGDGKTAGACGTLVAVGGGAAPLG